MLSSLSMNHEKKNTQKRNDANVARHSHHVVSGLDLLHVFQAILRSGEVCHLGNLFCMLEATKACAMRTREKSAVIAPTGHGKPGERPLLAGRTSSAGAEPVPGWPHHLHASAAMLEILQPPLANDAMANGKGVSMPAHRLDTVRLENVPCLRDERHQQAPDPCPGAPWPNHLHAGAAMLAIVQPPRANVARHHGKGVSMPAHRLDTVRLENNVRSWWLENLQHRQVQLCWILQPPRANVAPHHGMSMPALQLDAVRLENVPCLQDERRQPALNPCPGGRITCTQALLCWRFFNHHERTLPDTTANGKGVSMPAHRLDAVRLENVPCLQDERRQQAPDPRSGGRITCAGRTS